MSSLMPGACIGILGGGQLGKMLCIAAGEMGYRTHVYAPEDDAIAADVAWRWTKAAFDDENALRYFAQEVDVITLEFENIPASSLQLLATICPTHPGSQPLYLARNRLREKNFANELGIPSAKYLMIRSARDLELGLKELGPAILKTTELGYDGKGQVRIEGDVDCNAVWQALGQKEAILEALVPFVKEISCIVARRLDGAMAFFPIGENVHREGILRTSDVPAKIPESLVEQAESYTGHLAEGCNLVGLLSVEYFVTRDHQLLFNEMAPRPHNSGHWTQDACETSQFEQAIRAVCGLPFGSVKQTAAVRMRNLIGHDMDELEKLLDEPASKVHIYGKKEVRAGRKMGHVNELRA